MSSREEINKRIENIDASIVEINRISKLYGPLCNHLMPIRKRADIEHLPLKDRFIYLSAKNWPKQFKEGIDRCMGFDIKWVGGENNA